MADWKPECRRCAQLGRMCSTCQVVLSCVETDIDRWAARVKGSNMVQAALGAPRKDESGNG